MTDLFQALKRERRQGLSAAILWFLCFCQVKDAILCDFFEGMQIQRYISSKIKLSPCQIYFVSVEI